MAKPGQAARSSCAVIRDLRLVHRGLGHQGLARGQGTVGRAGGGGLIDLFAVLDQVREQLQRRGRITYRMLQAQFKLAEDDLEVLKAELIDGQRVATDEEGKVLVWVGTAPEGEKGK